MPSHARHSSDAEIERFCGATLAATELVTFCDHLAACATCRQRVEAVRSAVGMERSPVGGLDALVDHVSESDVQAYARDTLTPARRGEIDAHLARCERCASEIRDLQEFAGHQLVDVPGASRRVSRGLISLAAAAVLLIAAAGIWMSTSRSLRPAVDDANPSVAQHALPGDTTLSAEEREIVRMAVDNASLSIPATVERLRGASGAIMGSRDAAAFALASPVGTVVLEERPTFRWTEASGATSYQVTVQEESNAAPLTSPALHTTEWIVERPLARGATYRWQVAATIDGKETVSPAAAEPPARFQVVDATTAARLATLPASETARVALYAHAGLLDDAEREVARMIAGHHNDALAARWLEQLRGARARRGTR
jgi:hypothetical protein